MRKLVIALLFLLCAPSWAATWFVRSDGGTRYSSRMPNGQCNGQADAPYPGIGVNQPCAFKDVRYLWADGSYNVTGSFPGWGWVIASGDKVIVRNGPWRIGYNGPNSGDDALALGGNPYASGIPPIPSGTAAAHTQILGENYASCSSPSARTGLYGGYGVSAVFTLSGTSFVDIACFDITDHSSCGKSHQQVGCHTSYPIDDYADIGIATDRYSTNDSVSNVRIHGMAHVGWFGSTGDGFSITNVDLLGNPSAGWEADRGDGTTGTGNLTVSHMNIGWSGCSEEYPIVHALPYNDCTDDDHGGYGDGFGTATTDSYPGWHITFDHSSFFYNTQDGLDALHLTGDGSSLTVTNSLAYGNEGQQYKVGAASTFINNVAVGNCRAMGQNIPGTPAGFNKNISDFCRAADTTIALTVDDSAPTVVQNNTVLSAQATTWQVECQSHCGPASILKFQNNLFIGFPNNGTTGYPNGSNNYSNPLYTDGGVPSDIFTHPGSVNSNNAVFHAKAYWTCGSSYNEVNAVCVDPQLVDETWHMYGFGDMRPSSAQSPVIGRGTGIVGLVSDLLGTGRASSSPTIGAFEYSTGPLDSVSPIMPSQTGAPTDSGSSTSTTTTTSSSSTTTTSSSGTGSTTTTAAAPGTTTNTGSTDATPTTTTTAPTTTTTAPTTTTTPPTTTTTTAPTTTSTAAGAPGTSTTATPQSTTTTSVAGAPSNFIYVSTNPSQWTKVAMENQSVAVPAGTTVRYGVDSAWITVTYDSPTLLNASNAFFGSDPAYGTVKELDVTGTSIVAISGK